MPRRKPALQRKTGKSILTYFFRNLKENNLYYDNLQITQCVFLGELRLKPVPSIFKTEIKTEPYLSDIKIEMKIKTEKDVKPDIKKTAVKKPGKVTKKNVAKVKEVVRSKKAPTKVKLSPKKPQKYKIVNSPKKLLSVVKETKSSNTKSKPPTQTKKPVNKKAKLSKPKKAPKEKKKPKSVKKSKPKKVAKKVVKQSRAKKATKTKIDIIEISDDENDANKSNVVSASKKQPKKSTISDEVVYVGTEVSPTKLRQRTLDSFLKISSAIREIVEKPVVEDIIVISEDCKPVKRSSSRKKMEKPVDVIEVESETEKNPPKRSLRSGDLLIRSPTKRTLKPKQPKRVKSEVMLDITNDDVKPAANFYQNPDKIVEQIAKITGSTQLIDDLVLEIPDNPEVNTDVKRSPRLLKSKDVDAPTPKRKSRGPSKEKNKIIVLDEPETEQPTPKIDNTLGFAGQKPKQNAKVARVKPMMLLKETPVKDLYEFNDDEIEEVSTLRLNPKKTPPTTRNKAKQNEDTKVKSSPKNSQQRSIKDIFEKRQAEIDAVFAKPSAPSQISPNENACGSGVQAKFEGEKGGKLPLAEVGSNTMLGDSDDSDDDTRSHLEWMPDDYAQYKFQYSAKKVNSYRSEHRCKVCLANFLTYYSLNKHKRLHAKVNPYECQHCVETFADVVSFNAHLRIHKGKIPFSCKKCHRDFKTKEEMEEHEQVHVLKRAKPIAKRFRCDICAREFAKMSDMERHLRVHTGEKPSQCNICHKRFQHAYNLSKHLIIHLHVKPFECEICNRQFVRHDQLNRHLLTHSIEKPHKCQYCEKGFIRMGQVKKHIAVCHKTETTNLTKETEAENSERVDDPDVNQVSGVEA